MNHEERFAHMTARVEPTMRAKFQAQDPQRFADFGCATCHGSGASSNYAMPNPELPKLYTAGFYKKHRKGAPEMVEFMWKNVEPGMGDALGQTSGHGGLVECGSCHVLVK